MEKDKYINDGEVLDESIPSGETYFSWGLHKAISKAEGHEGIVKFMENGVKMLLICG